MATRGAVPSHRRSILLGFLLALLTVGGSPVPPASAISNAIADLNVTTPVVHTFEKGSWTVRFTVEIPIPSGGLVRTTYPAGFTVSAGSATACSIRVDEADYAGESTEVNAPARVVDCRLPQTGASIAVNQRVAMVLTNIQNPSTAGSYSVQVQTRDLTGSLEEGSEALSILASPLIDVAATAPLRTTGESETWTLSFTTTNAIEANGDFRVTFPEGFTLSAGATTVCDITTPASVTADTTVVDASQRRVTCALGAGDSVGSAAAVVLTLSHIGSRTVAGEAGPFEIRTRNAQDLTHDLDQGLVTALLPHPFGSLSHTFDDRGVRATNPHHFTFRTHNRWEADGRLVLDFPAGYSFHQGGTTTATFQSGGSGGFEAPTITGQTVTLVRTGGADIEGGTSVTVRLSHVRNPAASGRTGEFTVSTANSASGVHDRGTLAGVTIDGGGASSGSQESPGPASGAPPGSSQAPAGTQPSAAPSDDAAFAPSPGQKPRTPGLSMIGSLVPVALAAVALVWRRLRPPN